MAYWSWVPALETGIREVDEQHKKLVDYINILASAVKEKNTAKTEVVLDKLIRYTVIHFNFEEKLMKHAGYEYLAEHRLIHESFKVQVTRYRKRLAAGENVADELLAMLVRWLIRHIKEEDKAFAAVGKAHLEKGWVSRTVARFFGSKNPA